MNARLSRCVVSAGPIGMLVLAIAVPAAAGEPERWHARIEGGYVIYCDYDNDRDLAPDYIVEGRFWQEYQRFYFYDRVGNVIKVKTDWLWHGELSDPESGQVFTDRWAESERYDLKDWPDVWQISIGNGRHVQARAGGGHMRYHVAGRLVILWGVGSAKKPGGWRLLGILGQSGRWPEFPVDDVCGLFREGHVVRIDDLPTVVIQRDPVSSQSATGDPA